jgi:small-conductance mechanosensitive channel
VSLPVERALEAGFAQAAGIDWAAVGVSAAETLLRVLAVVLVARLIIILANRLIDRLASRRPQGRAVFDERRVHTLAGVAKSIVRYALDFFAGITALSLVGVDTSSLLLGAGVAGLAVGFGAQNLVRDVLSGFFLLLEDQYGVGDYVSMAGVEGIVEDVGLRTTEVRGFGGELHIIPNGAIPRVANLSRGPLRVLFEIPIAHRVDAARVMAVAQEAGDRFATGCKAVVEGPKVLGVSRLDASGVYVQVWARARSMEHWAVERDLKLAIKEALAAAGIDISQSYRRVTRRSAGIADSSDGGDRPDGTVGRVKR